MRSRWFVLLMIEEGEVRGFLDSIIFLCNPEEKNGAHITLRGPEKERVDEEYLKSIRKYIVGTKLSVIGVGRFFNKKQNTVFLRCGSRYLQKYWKKTDYPFNPHITIYNGESRKKAERIYYSLKESSPYFELTVGDVICLASTSGQKSFNLMFELDMEGIRKVIGRENPLSEIRKMRDWERLMLVDRLIPKMKWSAVRP